MSSSCSARMTRTAISPRLATRMRWNTRCSLWTLWRKLEAGDDALVVAFTDRPLGMTRRDPSHSSLGVRDDVGKALRGDAEDSRWFAAGIREGVKPRGAFGEIHHVAGRECLFAVRRADRRRAGEDEEHLLDSVMHVQRAAGGARQKLLERRSQHVRFERMPEPPVPDTTFVDDLVPGLVGEKVESAHQTIGGPASGSRSKSGCPNSTGCAFSTWILRTTASSSDFTSFMSFMASRMQSVCPAATTSPSSTNGGAPGCGAR